MITEEEIQFIAAHENDSQVDKLTVKRLEHIYIRETLDVVSNGCFCKQQQRNNFKNKFYQWYNNR